MAYEFDATDHGRGNYATRNLANRTHEGVDLPIDNFDGTYGRGLDDAGVKSIYGKHRGIHIEGILGDTGIRDAEKRGEAAPGAYPGMCVRIASQTTLEVGDPTGTTAAMLASELAADDARVVYKTGVVAGQSRGIAVLVEDDLRGAGVMDPYRGGQRIQAEIFTSGMECWLAVKPELTGGSHLLPGQVLVADSDGLFTTAASIPANVAAATAADTAAEVQGLINADRAAMRSLFAPFAILLQRVNRSHSSISAGDEEIGLAYCRIV